MIGVTALLGGKVLWEVRLIKNEGAVDSVVDVVAEDFCLLFSICSCIRNLKRQESVMAEYPRS